ncbi:MAG: GNAT family N-acetyltransferase [Flavobacteriales bacterium]|nr:GNAT family N-acetyltransferase [Flavobacteriales bacterium]
MGQYTFQRCYFSDLGALNEIYVKSFGGGGSVPYFQWKYLDNPAGKAIAYVAEADGKVAGFYGVIPEYWYIGGGKRILHQSMDTMTHPDHRGKGLFPKLAHMVFDRIREETGGLLVIGYPGPTSYAGFVHKLKWKSMVEMKYLFAYKWMFQAVAFFRDGSGAVVEDITTYPAEMDAFFAAHEAPVRPFTKYLDRGVLDWRLAAHPSTRYDRCVVRAEGRIVGHCAYRVDPDGRIFILLVDFLKRDLFDKYMRDVVAHLFKRPGTTAVHTFLATFPEVEASYRALGFVSNPFNRGPFSYRTPLIVLADPPKQGPDPYELSNWDVQPIMRDY